MRDSFGAFLSLRPDQCIPSKPHPNMILGITLMAEVSAQFSQIGTMPLIEEFDGLFNAHMVSQGSPLGLVDRLLSIVVPVLELLLQI